MKRLILSLVAMVAIVSSSREGEAGQRCRVSCVTRQCVPPVRCVCVQTGTDPVPVEQAATQITRTSAVVRECDGTVCRSRTVTRQTGGAGSLAQIKAQQLASMNRLVHLGGG